jgi:DMSO/TMAO reductase YedYZ molybdopterin-dependent catalytic subunit
VTPRGTDWSLALLVSMLFASGLLTWFSGDEGNAWVFAAHGIAGAALAILLGWKLRRVGGRVLDPASWDRHIGAGLAVLALVALTLFSGWMWSTAGALDVAGYTLIAWHTLLGSLLTVAVAVHLGVRAKRPRRRDIAGRRQLLEGAAIGLGALIAWRVQRPLSAALGLPGANRRFTGSYAADSFAGNAFPTTSWVADDPKAFDLGSYRLVVDGKVVRALSLPLEDLDGADELVATLDCTGGFYSRQRWSGVRLARLLERAGPLPAASHVRVISQTGYRWSFELHDARRLLLATGVGAEGLSHEHGAPVRLVAPGRRGFEWVKWVVRVELHDGPDPGAPASTVWSSFTPEGRGAA